MLTDPLTAAIATALTDRYVPECSDEDESEMAAEAVLAHPAVIEALRERDAAVWAEGVAYEMARNGHIPIWRREANPYGQRAKDISL